MNSKDRAVSCPPRRSMWVSFSKARFDLNIWILKIYTEVTASQDGKNNYSKGIAYHNSFCRISSGSYPLFLNHGFREHSYTHFLLGGGLKHLLLRFLKTRKYLLHSDDPPFVTLYLARTNCLCISKRRFRCKPPIPPVFGLENNSPLPLRNTELWKKQMMIRKLPHSKSLVEDLALTITMISFFKLFCCR